MVKYAAACAKKLLTAVVSLWRTWSDTDGLGNPARIRLVHLLSARTPVAVRN